MRVLGSPRQGARSSTAGGWRWALMVWLLLSGAGALAAQHAEGQVGEVVRFAPEKDYPPFIFVDAQGRLRGLSVDMLEALKPSLGLTIENLPAAPLAQILADLKAGRADLVSSLRPTEERRNYLEFSAPYALVPAVLVTHERHPANGLQDLVGQVVAVGEGYAVEGFVRQRHPGVTWRAVPDDTQALKLLDAGQVRGVVADVASVRYVLNDLALKDLQIQGPVGFEYHLSFAWRKELVGLGRSVDRALLNLSPRLRQSIMDRWLSEHPSAYGDPRQSWLAGAGAGLLFGGLIWLLWRSRRRAKTVPAAPSPPR